MAFLLDREELDLARGVRDPYVDLEGVPASLAYTHGAVDTSSGDIVAVTQIAKIINT